MYIFQKWKIMSSTAWNGIFKYTFLLRAASQQWRLNDFITDQIENTFGRQQELNNS